jgi:hypothetical protein
LILYNLSATPCLGDVGFVDRVFQDIDDFISGFRDCEFPFGLGTDPEQLARVQPDIRLHDAAFIQFNAAPVPIARLDDGERDFVARGSFRAIRFSQLQNHGTLYASIADQYFLRCLQGNGNQEHTSHV